MSYNTNFSERDPLIINDNEKAQNYQVRINERNQNISQRQCKFLKGCILVSVGLTIIFFLVNLLVFNLYVNDQMHLSYTVSNTDNLTATWISNSYSDPNYIYLEYFKDDNDITQVKAETTIFDTGYSFNRYTHRANFIGLNFNTTYKYRYKTNSYKSDIFTFSTPIFNKSNVNIVLFGDLGLFYGDSRDAIIDYSLSNPTNFLFHLGDIAYDLNTYFGYIGDIFLSQIQSITSHIPYMVIPGNHESYDNFSNYINRFTMPNYITNKNLFYTIEKPPIKMINLNTEAYYFQSMAPTIQTQLNFLENELKNTNRIKYPWLITTGHRPMYYGSSDEDDYDKIQSAFEQLFYKYNVTIYFAAHENFYQRICPIYNGTCQTGMTNTSNYILSDLKYPINIITGASGSVEANTKLLPKSFCINSFEGLGFGVINANYSQFKWTQYAIGYDHYYNIDSMIIDNI